MKINSFFIIFNLDFAFQIQFQCGVVQEYLKKFVFFLQLHLPPFRLFLKLVIFHFEYRHEVVMGQVNL